MTVLSLPVELGLTVISWTTLAAGCLLPSGLAYRLVAPHLGSAAALSAACAIVLLSMGLALWFLRRSPAVRNAFAQAKALLGLRPDTLLLLKSGLFYSALNGMNVMPWQEATFAAFIWRLLQVCTEFATLIPCLTLPKPRLRPAAS